METILRELQQLAGVEHGCIFHDGEIVATTFPEAQSRKLLPLGRVLDQIFNGSACIGKAQNEVFFELEKHYLLGYRIERNFIITLLTGKQINFSLLHLSIRSAATEIKMDDLRSKTGRGVHRPPAPTPAEIDEEMSLVLEGIQTALTYRIGPIAGIVFEEHFAQWKREYEPTFANLGHLISALSNEIPDTEHQDDFLEEARSLTD